MSALCSLTLMWPSKTVPDVTHGGGSVMVWAALQVHINLQTVSHSGANRAAGFCRQNLQQGKKHG